VRSATLAEVRRLVSDVFNQPVEKVDARSSPSTIEAWDSIRHLNLVLAVEEKFGVQFSPDELEAMGSVGKICELVESKRGSV
jgi:acyl carrier protein